MKKARMSISRSSVFWLAGVFIAGATTHAAAQPQVVVEYWSTISGWTNYGTFGSGVDFNLQTTNDQTYRIYGTTPATTDIGKITHVLHSGIGVPTIFIGKVVDLDFNLSFPTPVAARDFGGLTGSPNRRVQFNISGDLTGIVTADELGQCNVGGELSGAIVHNVNIADPAPWCGKLVLGSVASSGLIECRGTRLAHVLIDGEMAGLIGATNEGDVGRIDCSGSASGTITGEIQAEEGLIAEIWLDDSAAIGSVGALATITARDGIGEILCGEMHADVIANYNGSTGIFTKLHTASGGISGTITAQRLGDPNEGFFQKPWFDIKGDIAADIVSASSLNQVFFCTGGITSNGSISFPAGGLQHQMFFNTDDTGTTPFDGDITVGSLVIDDPEYDYLPGILGGGSVGVVRYGINDKACMPKNGTLIGGGGFGSLSIPPDEVVLEHYGPIEVTFQIQPIVTVERRTYPVLWGGGQWTNVTSQYEIEIIDEVPNETYDDELHRRLRITPNDNDPFDTGYEYRITPTSNLTTDRLDHIGNKPLDDYVYQIRVLESFDLNLNGFVDAPDITVWAADPIDLNGDQSADSQDLADLLEEVGQSN